MLFNAHELHSDDIVESHITRLFVLDYLTHMLARATLRDSSAYHQHTAPCCQLMFCPSGCAKESSFFCLLKLKSRSHLVHNALHNVYSNSLLYFPSTSCSSRARKQFLSLAWTRKDLPFSYQFSATYFSRPSSLHFDPCILSAGRDLLQRHRGHFLARAVPSSYAKRFALGISCCFKISWLWYQKQQSLQRSLFPCSKYPWLALAQDGKTLPFFTTNAMSSTFFRTALWKT